MKNEPVDAKLYAKTKELAKKKFDVWPSAYGSGWLVKEYKRAFGEKYGSSKSPYYGENKTKPTRKSKSTISKNTRSQGQNRSDSSDLSRWFKEDWRNVCETNSRGSYKKCGRASTKSTKGSAYSYPYCRPRVRVSSKTPKTIDELSDTEINTMCRRKINAMQKRPASQKSPSRVYLSRGVSSGASVTKKVTKRSTKPSTKRSSRTKAYSKSSSRNVKDAHYYKVRKYVAKKIPILVREGYPHKKAIAIAFSMAEKKFGQ